VRERCYRGRRSRPSLRIVKGMGGICRRAKGGRRCLLGCCLRFSIGKEDGARDGEERGSLPDLGGCQ